MHAVVMSRNEVSLGLWEKYTHEMRPQKAYSDQSRYCYAPRNMKKHGKMCKVPPNMNLNYIILIKRIKNNS